MKNVKIKFEVSTDQLVLAQYKVKKLVKSLKKARKLIKKLVKGYENT